MVMVDKDGIKVRQTFNSLSRDHYAFGLDGEIWLHTLSTPSLGITSPRISSSSALSGRHSFQLPLSGSRGAGVEMEAGRLPGTAFNSLSRDHLLGRPIGSGMCS